MANPPIRPALRRQFTAVSPFSIYSDVFEAQILRDFLDYLLARHGRPVLIVSRNRRGGLSSLFPRPKERRTEFFEYLLTITAGSRADAKIESVELRHVTTLMEAELTGGSAKPEWRVFLPGIHDLYIPIRPASQTDQPASLFLVFGKFGETIDLSTQSLNSWINGLEAGSLEFRLFSRIRAETRRRQLRRLHQLARELPVINDAQRERIEASVLLDVRLLENFLGRTFTAGRFFRKEALLDHVHLENPSIDVTERELWDHVGEALKTIARLMKITAAAVYFADYRDYTYLKKVSCYPPDGEMADVLQFPTLDEFSQIQETEWLLLPHATKLTWLTPESFLKTSRSLLFARELSMSHLVVLAVGFNPQENVTSASRFALWDVVNTKVFPFIERAFAAIDLDQLLGDAGHLLGRTIGTVKSAAELLNDILREMIPPGGLGPNEKEFNIASWALQTGAMKLELIRQNFYQLANQKFDSPDGEERGPDSNGNSLRLVDLAAIIADLRPLFDTEAQREHRLVVYHINVHTAQIMAHENSLKAVLLNLWDNALKFSYNRTIVTLDLSVKFGHVYFAIEDVGMGVPPDERRLVFRPRFKSRLVDETNSRRKQGLGLGLAFCRRKIEHDFGGQIELISTPERKRSAERFEGDSWTTTVIFSLPIAPSEPS